MIVYTLYPVYDSSEVERYLWSSCMNFTKYYTVLPYRDLDVGRDKLATQIHSVACPQAHFDELYTIMTSYGAA